MAGAPKGNNNAGNGAKARHALDLAVRHGGEDTPVASDIQCLVDIWNKMIEQAKEGNPQAANMIMDRLDGKPAQSIAMSGELITKERVLTAKEAKALNDALEDAN